MGRYRRRTGITTALSAGDPGKDLFAYLFLLIMVFAFMLLMSFEQAGANRNQDSPETKQPGQSSLASVSRDKIAVLEKKGTSIVLKIGDKTYNPETQMDQLIAQACVSITQKQGKTGKILYVKKENQKDISLFDYLETFQKLSEKKISIVFVSEI